MYKDGKYIYCIIAAEYDHHFGPIGIGGRGDLVTTIGFDGISMVVSDHPLDKFTVNPENILAHQQVIEAVMKEYSSVLPLRFGTVAATPDEIRNLLNRRYGEFMELLRNFDNMVEMNLKCVWKDMKKVFAEIDAEHKDLKKIRTAIDKEKNEAKRKELMAEAGALVEKALSQKKDKEGAQVFKALRRSAVDFKENKTTGDDMFFNMAFLIDSGREKEIDNIISDLGNSLSERVDFHYTYPLPIFNFIDLKIFPEKWEI